MFDVIRRKGAAITHVEVTSQTKLYSPRDYEIYAYIKWKINYSDQTNNLVIIVIVNEIKFK